MVFEINAEWVQTHCLAQYTGKFYTSDILSVPATISSSYIYRYLFISQLLFIEY